MRRRALATSVASRLGLISWLERFASRPCLAIVVYHRVLRGGAARFDPHVVEATPELFDEQMAVLRKDGAVVDPEELRELLARPEKIRRLRVAITFDDGYRDNYDEAFPILKAHGLRATFFVTTGLVGGRELPWWDRIAHVVRSSERTAIELSYPEVATIPIGDAPDRAIQAVLRTFKRPDVDPSRFLSEIESACGTALPAQADERQFLSWDEAGEMERAGMAIASHTHGHRILARLSPEAQRGELERSRAELSRRGHAGADLLAYPVGDKDCFSDETRARAREAGYRFGFSSYGGVNVPKNLDPFDVKRMSMPNAEDPRELRLRLALAATLRREPW